MFIPSDLEPDKVVQTAVCGGDWWRSRARTVGYEIAEQLGWRIPSQVVIPVASSRSTRLSQLAPALVGLPESDRNKLRPQSSQAGC